MIRNKEHQKGVEQYLASLSFIHDTDNQSKLIFNLGLAYLRNYEFKRAFEYFSEAAAIAPPSFKKPLEFKKKSAALMAIDPNAKKFDKDFDQKLLGTDGKKWDADEMQKFFKTCFIVKCLVVNGSIFKLWSILE